MSSPVLSLRGVSRTYKTGEGSLQVLRGVDLSVAVWRGLAVPKATPQEIVDVLGDVARKAADDAVFREALAKANLGWSYADAPTFQAVIDKDRAFYKALIPKLDMAAK